MATERRWTIGRSGNWWFGVSLPSRRSWTTFRSATLLVGLGPWTVTARWTR